MITNLNYNNNQYQADLLKPLDISVNISPSGLRAWGLPAMSISPVVLGDWVGDTNNGSAVNFNNLCFNPHAHTTHTECVGHISKSKESINKELSQFFFITKLITVKPQKQKNDFIINKDVIEQPINKNEHISALIIRTLPNKTTKKSSNYTNSNPPYLSREAAKYLHDIDVKHLLIDLPSLDKEQDGGSLLAHKAFWGFPDKIRKGCTITELVYVPNNITDGIYLLNLQFIPIENDASPSRPVLFEMKKISR